MANMKAPKRLGAAGLALLASLTVTVALSGETGPEPVTGSVSLGTFNRYIFRGYRLGRDSVVFEPALSVSYRGFSAIFWGNIDMKEKATPSFVPDRPGQKSFNETDLTALLCVYVRESSGSRLASSTMGRNIRPKLRSSTSAPAWPSRESQP